MHTNRSFYCCSPGPWGDIEYVWTHLDPPAFYFEELLQQLTTQWFFQEISRKEVIELLESCGLGGGKIPASWLYEAAGGILIEPPNDFLEITEIESIQEIQKFILRRSGNLSSLGEFVVENGDFRASTVGLDLPEELVRWTQERCFQLGGRTIFADTRFALSRITDAELRVRFLRALARTRSMIARLNISTDSDLKEIANWWSSGPNFQRPLPLLEAALETRGVETIDLIHLLPPGAKRVLNTFALRRDVFNGFAPDCYWAAMNFFEGSPSNRFLDVEIPRSYYFVDRFEKIPEATNFGDVISLSLKDGDQFIHACVYIAEEIVYTKNGGSMFFPYVLMNQNDMMTRYLPEGEYNIDVYRFRNR